MFPLDPIRDEGEGEKDEVFTRNHRQSFTAFSTCATYVNATRCKNLHWSLQKSLKPKFPIPAITFTIFKRNFIHLPKVSTMNLCIPSEFFLIIFFFWSQKAMLFCVVVSV